MTDIIEHLKFLLGTENKSQWLKFMDEVEKSMPFLSNSGAPRKADIAISIIGLSGRKSWAEFIENDLDWSYNSWKAWKKAFLQVKKYPYLREAKVSASEINTFKREKGDFPSDLEAFNELRSERQAVIDKTHEESVSTLKIALSDANTEIEKLKSNPQVVEKIVEKEKIITKKVIRKDPKTEKFLKISIALNMILIASIILIFAF